MKKILLIITLLTVNFSNSQESWLPLGPDDFNQPTFGKANYYKIIHDNNNVPYVAFSDVFNDEKITVRKYINNKWITVGSLGFSDGIATYISIDFDSNNIPYVAYKDTDIKIKKFDGTNWQNVGNAFASTNFDFSFKIAGNNIPYIAFQNSLNSNKATVKKFNGSTWELVGIDGISANQSNYISLAINNQNIPYIAYSDVSSVNKASVQKFNGITWEYVGSQAFTLGEATYTSIKFDNNNIPYILYRDGATSGKATLQKFLNNNWSIVGISGFTSANALDLNFTFDSNNNPFVVYKTDNGYKYVSVYKFNKITWANVGNQYISDRQADYSSISIDKSNNLFIAYKDVENGNTGVVKKFTNNTWTIIGDEPFTKETSSMRTVTDSNNGLYVLHQEYFENTLTVKKYFNGQWTQVGNSLGGVYYDACDIAIDKNDNLYVAHFNTGVGNGFKVKKFDKSTNSWITLPSTGLPSAGVNVFETSIDINSDNEPIVIWQEDTSTIFVKKFNGTSWTNLNSTPLLGLMDDMDLFIDKNIIPNILYLSYGSTANVDRLAKFTNGTWSSISGFGSRVKLKNNILYSIFQSPNTILEIRKFNGTTWEKDQNTIPNIDINESAIDFYLTPDLYMILTRNSNTNNFSLHKFDGTIWSTTVSNNISSGKSNFGTLSLINNIPVYIYSGDKGCFGKYYGTENALSLSDFNEASNFNTYIYPNPVLDKFKIKTDDTIISAKLYDVLGKEILDLKIIDSEIDISNLEKGIYLIKIQQLNSTKTLKLMKN